MTDDRQWMLRAIELAQRGRTSPNPRVGAVIVKNGEVIGEGFHERAGAPHAEVAALADARARGRQNDVLGATLYCSLEPCNHFGRTPPCTDAIIAAGITRLVIGCEDPKIHVGREKGTDKLQGAGIPVSRTCETEAEALIEDFRTFTAHGRPWIWLKSALTLDGRFGRSKSAPEWITQPATRRTVHRMRASVDAVMVGIGTVLTDDPMLTVRDVEAPPNPPIRVVLDRQLRMPKESALAKTANDVPVWLFTSSRADASGLESLGVRVFREQNENFLSAALATLARSDVMRVLAEPGPTLASALFESGFVDQWTVHYGTRIIGAADAPGLSFGPTHRSALRFRSRSVALSEDGDVMWTGIPQPV